MNENDLILFGEDSRGIYLPQHFAQSVVRENVAGVDDEQWAILESGPDHEHYWVVWTEVMDNATITDPSNGITYTVYQDGDVWLVPEGYEWPEQM